MTLLTELSTPTTVITLLDTQWNAGVIAKPNFIDGFYGDLAHDGNTVMVGWSQISLDSADLGTSNDEVNNFFEITIISEHTTLTTARTNLLKLLSETRRIVNRLITNGQWHLDTGIPAKEGHEQILFCSLREHFDYIGD